MYDLTHILVWFSQISHNPCERIRAEADTSMPMTNSRKTSRIKQEMKQSSPESAGDCKEEPDFIETNCHWKDCTMEFPTQEDLVKVSFFAGNSDFNYRSNELICCFFCSISIATIFKQIRNHSCVVGKIVREKRSLLKLSTCWLFICVDIPEKNLTNAPYVF